MPSSADLAWTSLAHLLRPQGRKGEVLAELLTDFPERFREHPEVFLAGPDFNGPESEARAMTLVHHWLPVGRNNGRVVLAFAGIDSINLAEALAGLDVVIPTADRIALEGDAEYIDDLIGCTVYDAGSPVGTVEAVDFPTTPDGSRRVPEAAPLLVLRTPDGEEVLIPYVQAFLLSLSVADKRIEMSLPAGLVEVNGTAAEPAEEPDLGVDGGPQ